MKPIWLVIAAAIVLPGCSAAAPIGPIVDTTPPVASPPAVAKPIAASMDKCDAAELAWLVGRSRNEIPVPVDTTRRRVACTTCMVTEDYRPDRTTIRYDAATGIVKSVTCG
jgi:hypothetical protein